MSRFLSWLMASIPRAPRRAGLLMRLYYVWKEYFTYAGKACAALFLFSVFAGAVAGFWAAWVFSGFAFLFILALVPSLFMTARKTRVTGNVVRVENAVEGEYARVTVHYRAGTAIDCLSLSCLRMDPSLAGESSPEICKIPAGVEGELVARVRTQFRGAFRVPKVALVVPEIKGMLCCPFSCGETEILVYPRVQNVVSFPFLTAGQSGLAFVPLLMPDFLRGLDFVGVREYREGDSLRDLHHKAFARYGRPFTKEFESERGAGVVFVLDTRTRNVRDMSRLEHLIRLASGIGMWLLDRGIFGRFFVCDDEIAFTRDNLREAFLESLARVPRADLRDAFRHPQAAGRGAKPADLPWSPAARPMGPVLRLGLYPVSDPLVSKQVVVCERPAELRDDTLFVPVENLDAGEVSL